MPSCAKVGKKAEGSNFDLYTKAVQTPWTIENFESHLLEKLEDKLSPPAPTLPSK